MDDTCIRPADICAICGAPVPEGRQICWACENFKQVSGAAGPAPSRLKKENDMKLCDIKNCETCDNYFCEPERGSPCEKCLTHRGRTGWQPMSWLTRLRYWIRRLV